MKKLILGAAAMLLLAIATPSQAQTEEKLWLVEKGATTPDFKFTWKGDRADAIQNHRGKVVLINFFATWCPPCRQELPRVQAEIWDKYKDRKDFALFVFGREEGWDKLDPFIAQTGYTFPILPDLDRSIFALYATQSIPRNVILDRNGKVIYQSIGYNEEEFNDMLKLLEAELKKQFLFEH